MDSIPQSSSIEVSNPEAGRPPESEPQLERSIPRPAAAPQTAPEPVVTESAVPEPLVPLATPTKSQLQKEIEDVLEEDLHDLYLELAEPERLIFKHKGEVTASKIRLLLGETKVRVQEIFRLIVEWLRFLPGVSQFFIEKEAKIKTDKLLRFR